MKKKLEKWNGVRPRLYFNQELIAELKEKIAKDSQYSKFTEKVMEKARNISENPPEYENDDHGNLWQREVGNRMGNLAIGYLLCGKQEFLKKAKKWVVQACSYPVWHETLGRSHLLFGVSVVYDWLHDYLDEESRKIIQEKLVKEAARQLPDRSLANHYWIAIAARGTAGMALYGDREEALNLIESAVDKYAEFSEFLGEDGASQEGVCYWQYALEYMLKFMFLAKELLGINFYNHPWFENTAYYALYLSIPRSGWEVGGPHVDFGDCPRFNWYGPNYLYRGLASAYGNEYIQWLAKETDKIEGKKNPFSVDINWDNGKASWLNLIWYDSNIKPQIPQNLPTLHHFQDMGIVSSRSDWSGKESLVVFKCAPALGHHVTEKVSFQKGDDNYLCRNSAGHCHPDANSFVIFASGEWLVRNPGYVLRLTDYQNNLLVDGKGQLGQAERWWTADEQIKRKLHPQILKAKSTPDLDHIIGDATESYPDLLARFERHLLFLKPNILIVIDDIATKNHTKSSQFELLFHLENKSIKRSDASYLATGNNAKLCVELLTSNNVEIGCEEQKILSRGSKYYNRHILRVMTENKQWRNAVAFSWSLIQNELERVSIDIKDEVWTFKTSSKTVSFDWKSKTVNRE